MGIGKGKSDKIGIDGLIGDINNESKVAQEESKLEPVGGINLVRT